MNWKAVMGMRDKIIHEYFGVSFPIVWETIKKEIRKEAFTLADLLRILDEHRCACEAQHVKQSLARLELAFILSKTKQHYTFCVPIFKKMILEQEPELLLEKECSGL